MTVGLALKLIDVAFLALSAWDRYESNKAATRDTLAELQDLRSQILLGDADEAEALARLDTLIAGMRSRRHAALAKLPKPPLYEVDDGD